MSDFLFSTRRHAPGALSAVLARWLEPAGVETEERHGEWGSLAVALPGHERYALYEGVDALTVVVGSPVARLPGREPGLIGRDDTRARVHALLADPVEAAGRLDGQFATLRVPKAAGGPDRRGMPRAAAGGGGGPGGGAGPGRPEVVTDRFGFVAVYTAEAAGGRLIGTHVDAVAEAAGRGGAVDLVSAADLVASYASTWPWTLYDGVLQLVPGGIHTPGAPGWTIEGTPYWRPREPEPGRRPDRRALAGSLRDALRESVAAATRGADRAAVLLSGGEDSRAVLAALPSRVRGRGVAFAEWESREVRVARSVARALGAELDVVYRGPDHYAAGFADTTRLAGTGHLFVDIHGLGLDPDPPLRSEPVVLGGLSADALLKGDYAPKHPAGRYRSPRPAGIRAELLDAADERRNEALERMRAWRPESAEEWLRLWPFSMRKHSGNVEGNRRLFRSWEAFHARGILDVAVVAAPADTVSRRLFREAMRPLFRRTWWIPHADYRFPWLGPMGNALALPGLAVARGVRAVATGQLRVRHRPWPKWKALVASEAMRAREEAIPVLDGPLAGLFDQAGRQDLDASRGSWYALRRLMLLQLAADLGVHGEDRG